DEHVYHVGDGRFRLSDADRLDQHHVVAGSLDESDRLARGLGYTAQALARGRGPDEGRRVGRKPAHTRFVAKDRAPAARGGRVDGENGDLVALSDEVQAELIDQGGFSGAGRAANAHADCTAGIGEETLKQLAGARLVLRLDAFDQGDGAGEHHPV